VKLTRLSAAAGAGVLALASLVIAPSAGAATTTLTFAYDFPGPDFELVPVVVAQDHGFFKAAGLIVKVAFPSNTSTTTKMLATGSSQIGFLTTTDMVVAADAGVPVLSVANYSMRNNWALFAKPGTNLSASSLKTLLKGKRVFSYGDTWTEAMLPFVIKYAGLTSSQVKVVTDPTGNDLTALLAGKVDFSTSTTNYELPGYAGTGKKGQLAQLLGTKAGAPNVPIWVYAVTKSYAAANAKTIKSFLTAVKRATVWAAKNPVAAAAEFTKAYPTSGYSAAYNKMGWGLTVPFLTNSSGQYFTQTSAQWSTLAKALKGIKLIKSVKPASAYYTNKFLP
jgi:putative hydroxymethylpyrimidine transport system substrate-binding protein